jgi:hypothetical protein
MRSLATLRGRDQDNSLNLDQKEASELIAA